MDFICCWIPSSQRKKKTAILNDFFQKNEDALRELGFILDDQPSIFLPVKIDAAALAEAVGEGQPEDGLAPFSRALESLTKSKGLFDGLVDTVRAQEKLT